MQARLNLLLGSVRGPGKATLLYITINCAILELPSLKEHQNLFWREINYPSHAWVEGSSTDNLTNIRRQFPDFSPNIWKPFNIPQTWWHSRGRWRRWWGQTEPRPRQQWWWSASGSRGRGCRGGWRSGSRCARPCRRCWWRHRSTDPGPRRSRPSPSGWSSSQCRLDLK